jgi:hypothetical protein
MRCPKTLATIVIVLGASACAGDNTAPGALPVEVLHASIQCGDVAGPSVRPVSDAAALRAAIAPGLNVDEPGKGSVELPLPGVATLLRVDMGERPTAGYALAVARAEHSERRLVLHVDWQEPAPRAIVAQVVTRPCVIIRLPPVAIDEVHVLDRSGRMRISQRLAR